MKLSKNMNRISFQKLYFYLLAILILRLDLISLNTMPTGGDMGAHVVPIKYFIDNFALNLFDFTTCCNVKIRSKKSRPL